MIEKSADPLDLASQLMQQHNEQASHARDAKEARRLREYRRLLEDGDIDGEHCMDCDIELPELRRTECRLRCTECETKQERKR